MVIHEARYISIHRRRVPATKIRTVDDRQNGGLYTLLKSPRSSASTTTQS